MITFPWRRKYTAKKERYYVILTLSSPPPNYVTAESVTSVPGIAPPSMKLELKRPPC